MTSTDTAGFDGPVPFAVLAARFGAAAGTPPAPTFTSLSAAIASGRDPGKILAYLDSVGFQPQTLDQLIQAINGLDDEEELHAWTVTEGVAVSVASDGAWHVFTP